MWSLWFVLSHTYATNFLKNNMSLKYYVKLSFTCSPSSYKILKNKRVSRIPLYLLNPLVCKELLQKSLVEMGTHWLDEKGKFYYSLLIFATACELVANSVWLEISNQPSRKSSTQNQLRLAYECVVVVYHFHTTNDLPLLPVSC